MQHVERWCVFEVEVKGKIEGNPFVDYQINGCFESKNESKVVEGFYDGDGTYRVRFMPSFCESYHYSIQGTGIEGIIEDDFEVIEASEHNHGPVKVAHQYHFAYEDGTPYFSIGTTCYVWAHQSLELQEKTLKTLETSAFNKIRFCIFPKHYDYNFNEPRTYPYIGTPVDSSQLTKSNFWQFLGKPEGNDWNLEQFNPEHFQHIEKQIIELMELGIEADLIVMHPYDRWGFSQMTKEQDDLYWRYVLARFSAYRNVWWSLANEYDLMSKKNLQDWERYASLICQYDPYNHLRSIHNCGPFYDYSKPWITHCSIQRQDIYKSSELVGEWRQRWNKPIVLDEIAYEGNIQHGWGNISGEELVRRFWEATCRGGYAGHGETYMHPEEILWWSHGGDLHGESPARFKFLQSIMAQFPETGLMPYNKASWDEVVGTKQSIMLDKSFFLYYYGFNRPSFREIYIDDATEYEVDVIDTWEMTINNVGVFSGKFTVSLPGKSYMAVRLRRKS